MKRLLLLSLILLSLGVQANVRIIEELSIPIVAYNKHSDNNITYLDPTPGELLITFSVFENSSPNLNTYSIYCTAYSDKSKNPGSRIFKSSLNGISQYQANQNHFGRNKCIYNKSNNYILISNGTWATRFAMTDKGIISVTYGRPNKSGTMDQAVSIVLGQGQSSTWNKLVTFLLNAFSHNMGKTYNL